MLKLLEFLVCFDWVSPMLGVFNTARRETRTFFVPLDSEWSGASIEALLALFNVEMLAWEIYGGQQFFHVDADQAELAYSVLVANGVPLVEQL